VAKNGIPGYEEALSQERRERNLAYLNLPFEICGIIVRQITPFDYCALVESRSPFVVGGKLTRVKSAHFIFLLSDEFKGKGKEDSIKIILERLCVFSDDKVFSEISDLVEITFRDAGTGQAKSAPVASSAAWLEYRMGGEPWRWDRERTLKTPLRIIYQQIRCDDKVKGEIVKNELSHKAQGDWLKALNEGIQDGSITPEMLAKFQEAQAKRKDA